MIPSLDALRRLAPGTVVGCEVRELLRLVERDAATDDLRASIADEIRAKIADWEPHCSDRYIRGMRAALLYVTGEAHQPLWLAAPTSGGGGE